MKIKISKQGYLEIERRDKMKLQFCPFTATATLDCSQNYSQCGDWCPLFGEPEKIRGNYIDSEIKNGIVEEFYEKKISLKICKKEFIVNSEDFTDERE